MATTVEQRTYEDAVQWLRDHGFDLIEAPGRPGRVFVRKYNVSAAIEKDGEDGVKIFASSQGPLVKFHRFDAIGRRGDFVAKRAEQL